ncbi:hypothetical protein BC962_3212 [Gillisia mitskevichiae]|uniref:DUF4163 domain-containing protein n=1 Tax=Gillisia mitskevichiae TaxID=270921 RepID=A0A495NXQ9_9FLAO|nr:hypothetical protein [Gillisia mitskevichiae]RKS42545.1 hypothetical protein BC962_3212 [Gillisia mitskevichiae]
MKILIILSFLFFSINIFGQNVQIDTLKIILSERINDLNSTQMNYPLIRTGDKKIDSLINYDLKNKVTLNEMPTASIDSTLNEWASYGVVSFDFDVNYNKNGILSLEINGEGCGAYCETWSNYYNYSTINGKALKLSDILELEYLKEDIYSRKSEQYEKNRKELKQQLEVDEGLDLRTYNFILERYNECDSSFQIDEFALFNDRIEIIENCYMIHALRAAMPFINIEYKLSDIKEYLIIKN